MRLSVIRESIGSINLRPMSAHAATSKYWKALNMEIILFCIPRSAQLYRAPRDHQSSSIISMTHNTSLVASLCNSLHQHPQNLQIQPRIHRPSLRNRTIHNPRIHRFQLQRKRILVRPPDRRHPVRPIRQRVLDHHGRRQPLDERSVDAYFDGLRVAKDLDRCVKAGDLVDAGFVGDGEVGVLEDCTFVVSFSDCTFEGR